MEEVYEGTQGDQNIIAAPSSWPTLLERKKLYIDDNLFVGSMASTVNGIYTYPEWNVEWMKEDNTVEKSKDPGGQEGQPVGARVLGQAGAEAPHAGDLREEVRLRPETLLRVGLRRQFFDWPGGGGNLNYPRVYNHGLAAMIKEVEERQKALDMRLPNAGKLYFYEASLIIMRAIVRLAHRYAELAREMAAKEKDATRKAGADRDRRDLRVGARASRPEPAGSHPVPLLLPHLRGARAGRLRLLRGLSGPEPRALLPARQGGRADRLRKMRRSCSRTSSSS